jgi:hypothetical protein
MVIRIRFNSEQDCVKGNWVLIKNTFSRRLRGDIFEIAETDRKLLDDQQLHYTIVPVEANGAGQEVRIPITSEIQRRNGN